MKENLLNILITNGATHLSSQLAKSLSQSHQIRLTDRKADLNVDKNIEYVKCDLENDSATDEILNDIETIIHSGETNHLINEKDKLELSMRCTYNLLWAASKSKVSRVIFLSSLEIMNQYPETYTVTETWMPNPGTDISHMCYYLVEFICREFGREGKLDIICLRLGTMLSELDKVTDRAGLHISDAISAVNKAITLSYDKNIDHTYPKMRPGWNIFHIQSDIPNGRYLIDKSRTELGYEPCTTKDKR